MNLMKIEIRRAIHEDATNTPEQIAIWAESAGPVCSSKN